MCPRYALFPIDGAFILSQTVNLSKPFLITSLADHRHLTPIESHPYEKRRGGHAWPFHFGNSSPAIMPCKQPTISNSILTFEQFLHPRHVFRNIHAHRVVLHFRHANLPAILQPAKLLELLDAL